MVNKIVGFKVLIFPLAAVFVVMMSVLYIKPAYYEMQTLKQSQTQKQLQLGDLQAQNQKLAELKSKWDSMEDERSLMKTAFPANSDMENYIAELYGRASRSGVLLSNITSDQKSSASESNTCVSSASSIVSASPSSPAAPGEASGNAPSMGNAPAAGGSPASATSQSCANAVSVKMAASGSWDQIVNFFKYLEDTNRIANITSVALTTTSQQNASNQQSSNDIISATVDLSVFYKEESKVGSSSVINGLASGKGFEESVIKKLNEVVFAPYVAPAVSASGERNIFK